MNKLEEIKLNNDESIKIVIIDKHELESLKKITKTTKITDYEVLTDDGFVGVEALHQTIPYGVYHLKLSDGKELKCADNHIVFYLDTMEEVFVKNLSIGDKIGVYGDEKLDEAEVISIENLGYEEVMYDLELNADSNRRYYTNGVLSHNTHLAKELAKQVFGSEDALIRIDMSEYQEQHSISRLIGSPPGYVGHEEGGQLTEQVKNKPYCVILLDEVEKANKNIYQAFLQMLDDGHLTDGLGRKINFKNCIVIMTSNLGVRKLQEFGTGMGFSTGDKKYAEEEQKREILKKELQKFFAPEFLNRIDEVIFFNKLSKENVKEIVKLEAAKLIQRIKKINYHFLIDDSVIELIAEVGFDENYGARPLKRALQDKVEDYISEEILNGVIKEGQEYKIIAVEGEIQIEQPTEQIIEKPKRGRKKKGDE